MRSIKKGIFVDSTLLEEVKKREEEGSKAPISTQSRSSTIVPEFVGHSFLVHNGKRYIRVFITNEMVGHKLGEFSLTRVFKEHTFVTKKSRQKVKK